MAWNHANRKYRRALSLGAWGESQIRCEEVKNNIEQERGIREEIKTTDDAGKTGANQRHWSWSTGINRFNRNRFELIRLTFLNFRCLATSALHHRLMLTYDRKRSLLSGTEFEVFLTLHILAAGTALKVRSRLAFTPGGGSNTNTREALSKFTGT